MRKEIRENKYFKWGVTALAAIVIALVCNQILNRWDYVTNVARVVVSALRPIILGLVFAYVLNPLLNVYEKYIFGKIFGGIFKKSPKVGKRFARGAAIIFTLVTALAVVAGLMLLIIPELYVNINRLVTSMPGYIENTIVFLTDLSKEYPDIVTPLIEYFRDVSQDILVWAREKVLPGANEIITNLSMGIYGTFMAILDVVIGVIVAIYVLGSKERYAGGARKYAYALFKRERAEKLIALAKYTDNHFGGFLVGKVVDSAIIGILSFVVFSIAGIPYTLLVSVIVGVTNVIPFFGPFIGAIPSGLLILLVDPIKALTFAVLILAIQQLDGNIIGPKILGDKTGLDSFAVIFAILVSGGLFGVVGMIVGVPVFATIFGIITDVCNKRLVKKSLPVEIEAYSNGKEIKEVISKEE